MLDDAILTPRVIPCLLIEHEGMVKTVQFENPKYLGDPVNVVNLFNQFEADEIVILDIRATVEHRDPPLGLIQDLAQECWVPLAYGGGIRSVDQARAILSAGVEKVIIGTAAADDPGLVRSAAAEFGSQAVVVSVDVRSQSDGTFEVFVESGRRRVETDPRRYARRAEDLGAGEILLQRNPSRRHNEWLRHTSDQARRRCRHGPGHSLRWGRIAR